MSNLSELLPAGAGAKSAKFVASGTLPSGQAVALKTNGQVEAISAVAQGVGAESVYLTRTTLYSAATYDSNSNKVVIGYSDGGNNYYGTAVVGTVSGTSISFGTPVVFETAETTYISLTFDSNLNKVVIAYRDSGNSGYGTSIVGTVSGTSISFGTAAVFESAATEWVYATFDSNLNKVVIAYRDGANSGYGTSIVATVSGTSISFGTAAVFESASTTYVSATFDSANNKVVIAYQDSGNSDYGTAVVGTVSGTSISFGTAVVFAAASTYYNSATFDSTNNKTVIAYRGTSNYGTAIIGTVSGTSISFGTAVVFAAASSNNTHITFDSTNGKIIIAYKDNGTAEGRVIAGTVSGTSISFDTAVVFNAGSTTLGGQQAITYDSTNNKAVIVYRDSGNSNYGTAIVFTVASSNNTSFLGITDAAISSAASGSVTIKGGISSNVTGLTANSNYYVQTDGSLNTATSVVNYDITNASFTQAFSVSSQDSAPQGVAFNTDGTKMFITGAQGQDVNEYALSTGFDVSTASFTDAFSVSAQDTAPAGIAFNADGTKMFIVGNTGDDVNEYTLSGGFDVSTASFVDSFDVSGQETGPWGLAFNPTGTKMFVCGNASDNVNEYALSAGFDVSTASFTVAFSVGSQDTGPLGLAFNTAGTQMFVLGQAGKDVNEYALSTGFDVSTASFVSTFSVASQETYPNNIAFSSSGAKMFVTGNSPAVNQYATTSTATNSTTVLAGRALSSTSINLDYTT